jgi:hypothetical protein
MKIGAGAVARMKKMRRLGWLGEKDVGGMRQA